jgi:hypothetical protein
MTAIPTDFQIIQTLAKQVNVFFELYDIRMNLMNFCKPSPRTPYFKIFFSGMLYNYDLNCSYDLFGTPWIDTINMRITDKIEFGFINDEVILWFPYKKDKTFPESGSGYSESDIDDYPIAEYTDFDRYNDLIEHLMSWFRN